MGIHPILGLLFAALSAAAFSLFIGVISLRFPGRFNIYYLIITLGFSEMLRSIWVNEWSVTGGTAGLRVEPFLPVTEAPIIYWSLNYYLIFGILLTLILFVYGTIERRFGFAIRAIYENEVTAATLGINVTRYKILATVIAGVFAGLAGAFFGHFIQVIAPDLGGRPYMLSIFFMDYAGGSGTILGPVLGAAVYVGLLEYLRILGPIYQTFVLTLIFILILRFLPRGIISLFESLYSRIYTFLGRKPLLK